MPTTTTAYEVAKRRGRPAKQPGRLTFATDFAAAFFPAVHAAAGITFPSAIYRNDPVRFGAEILGVEYWSKQIEILEAVRDHPRVAVKSGHKVGKSRLAAGAALWFYASFPHARVILTSTTSRQVDEILWYELRMLYAQAGRCLDCRRAYEEALDEGRDPRIPRPCPHSSLLDGDLGELARTGLKSPDFREIIGFTAKQAEAFAGISGANVLYIVDEASGVPEIIFEAIEGNRAGNARVLMLSNPTRNEGTFYDAFNAKSRFYRTISVSSEETPNVVAGRIVIPGLATREWIEEKKEEWGPRSPLYTVRAKGDFAEHEEGKIFSVHAIEEAEKRWHETPAQGRLWVGLDPAGPRGTGDEIAYAVRRGLKCVELLVRRGLTEEGHLVELIRILRAHKVPREIPVVVVDADGEVGSKVYLALRNYADDNPGSFEVVRVRASEKSLRDPMLFHLMRDALTASLAAWFDAGGAIPEDAKLAQELHAVEWRQRPDGRAKVTDKIQLRKQLGRSPDRYDALALSCWEPTSLRDGDELPPPNARAGSSDAGRRRGGLDPYAGMRAWERR